MEKSIVVVTGGTGYIASWIVHDLLMDGHEVRITVRDLTRVDKYQHLLEIEKKSTGTLVVFEAELMKEHSFDDAVSGASYVFHTASPFFLDDKNDPQRNLVDPAILGTKNVLSAVNKSESVKRVVLTSSIAAIYGDAKDMVANGVSALNEDFWNTTSSLHNNAYSYSKTEAEKVAWIMMKAQERWDLVTIHPGFVIGPSLTKRNDSTSIATLLRILRGEFAMGSPKLEFIFSDVRDVARGHLLAAFTPTAEGRYIIANESADLVQLGSIIDAKYPDVYKTPKRTVPKWLVWLIASKIGLTRGFVSGNIGYSLKCDNSKSVRELGMKYHTLKETVVDHVEQLQKDRLI